MLDRPRVIPRLAAAEWTALCDATRGPLQKFPGGYALDSSGPFHGPLPCSRLRGYGYVAFEGFIHKGRYVITPKGIDYQAARHCGIMEASDGT